MSMSLGGDLFHVYDALLSFLLDLFVENSTLDKN